MPLSHAVRLLPIALSVVSFGLFAPDANAETTYPFSANYDTTIEIKSVGKDVSQVFESGLSTDAPYDLNIYKGLTYAQTDPTTGEVSFDIDPTKFGLKDLETGYLLFEGGSNKIYGIGNASTSIDFEKLTASGQGTIEITGGEGLFENAKGTLSFTQEDVVFPGEILVLKGEALVTGDIQTVQAVPEPESVPTLIGIGAIGATILLLRKGKVTC